MNRQTSLGQADQTVDALELNHAGLALQMRTISSEVLFRGAQEIAIKHAGSIYRLRITRQGKLILNK